MAGEQDSRPVSLSGVQKSSFAFFTIRDRLPNILTKVIDVFSRLASNYHAEEDEVKAEDAKNIIAKFSKLKNEMQTDKDIKPIEDNYKDSILWNAFFKEVPVLEEGKSTPSWYSVAWLACECYMYRRIFEAMQLSQHHTLFDPFFEQKSEAFFSSEKPMQTLASYVMQFVKTTNSVEQGGAEKLRLDFEMLLEYCLWGNKCDLSISAGTQVSNQLKESSQLKDLLAHIISNHTEQVWKHVNTIKSNGKQTRIDFVLDNAGFELYSDLCFAEFLLDKQFCEVVHFHVKEIPWFVSDTSKFDFEWTVKQCCDSTDQAVKALGQRWQTRLNNKTFVIVQNMYWTLPHDFAAMKEFDSKLYLDLSESQLLVFKGDLNYRKLIGDRSWPFTTTFDNALHGFCPAPLCALRTLKADLVVGLQPGQDKELAARDQNWMISGQYAVIQFCKKL